MYPRLLLRKKIAQYILSVVFTSIVVALLPNLILIVRGEVVPNLFVHTVIKVFIGLFVMSAATAYRFILDVIKQQNILQENLSMELSFLRSQVSPHFMFNALNSMVSLARKRSEMLEPALLKMSDLMHYMLYDSDEDKVNLQREVEYIRSYIDLQTLRFGNSDGTGRNSTFNNKTVFNILAGREMKIGCQRRNIFSIDIKLASSGGRYYTPVDVAASIAANEEKLDETRYNNLRLPNYLRVDARFGLQLNSRKRKISHAIYLDLQNVTNRDNVFTQRYSTVRKEEGTVYQIGFFPDILYRLQF